MQGVLAGHSSRRLPPFWVCVGANVSKAPWTAKATSMVADQTKQIPDPSTVHAESSRHEACYLLPYMMLTVSLPTVAGHGSKGCEYPCCRCWCSRPLDDSRSWSQWYCKHAHVQLSSTRPQLPQVIYDAAGTYILKPADADICQQIHMADHNECHRQSAFVNTNNSTHCNAQGQQSAACLYACHTSRDTFRM